jgi:SAM-dependent methyltransferase
MSEAKSAGDCGMTASDFAPLRGASSGLRAVEVNRLETSMSATSDPRLYLPHVARNRDPILAVLRRVLPPAGLVLEVASGSGEHAIYFAQSLPALLWQPSDCDAQARASIAAHRAAAAVPNLLAPLELDVTLPWWPVERADALVCINMIHIAPWAAAQGLFAGARRILPAGGVVYLYGAYRIDGRHTAPSNERFDAWLRSQNRAWGVRDLGEVADLAADNGFVLAETVPMPANNLSVVFRRGGQP